MKMPDEKKPRGYVSVNLERCKGCGFCVAFCPKKVLDLSNDYNAKGYHYPVAFRKEVCSGCDQCGSYCPDFAIYGLRYS